MEELLEVLAQVAQSWFAFGSGAETVFRTTAVAGKPPFTNLTLVGQTVAFGQSETFLLFAVHHAGDGLLVDIAQFVLRIHEMVA